MHGAGAGACIHGNDAAASVQTAMQMGEEPWAAVTDPVPAGMLIDDGSSHEPNPIPGQSVASDWEARAGGETLSDMLGGPPDLLMLGGSLGLGLSPLQLPEWVPHRLSSLKDDGEMSPPAAPEVILFRCSILVGYVCTLLCFQCFDPSPVFESSQVRPLKKLRYMKECHRSESGIASTRYCTKLFSCKS